LIESWGAFGIRQGTETVRVADLKADVQRVWVKDTYRHNLVFLAAALLAFVVVGVLFLAKPLASDPWPAAMGSVVVLMLASLAFVALDPHRVEFACFKYSSGVLAMVVGRLGSHQDQFEPFVRALASRIPTPADAGGPQV